MLETASHPAREDSYEKSQMGGLRGILEVLSCMVLDMEGQAAWCAEGGVRQAHFIGSTLW